MGLSHLLSEELEDHVDVALALLLAEDVQAELSEDVRPDKAARVDQPEFDVPGVNGSLVLVRQSIFY